MGFFDDSDSEEDVAKRPLEIFNQENNPDDPSKKRQKQNDNKDYGDEEDPLDSFMSKLSSQSKSITSEVKAVEEEDPLDSYMNKLSSSSGAITSKIGGRLDVDNEEEATSHWRETKHVEDDSFDSPIKLSGKSSNSGTYTSEYLTAKAAMASTFHKAGARKSQNNFQDKGDDMSFCSERKRTIDPLEKANHSLIEYAPFQKIFLKVRNSSFGLSWRKENEVSCSIDVDPILSFEDYGPKAGVESSIFSSEVLSYLSNNGFKKATNVQAQSIPAALMGSDLIVTSKTGSGKTLAYILPLVTHVIDQPHIVANRDGPIALVLTPTRELAKQVFLVAKKVLHLVGAKVCAVTGGTGTYEMSKELKKGCELVVSTPGRFIDMVKRKATNCRRITFIVLDEADKMLDMGFETQCASIMNNVRPDRQTLMFSATFGKRVERAAKGWLQNPVRIAIGRTGSSSEYVDQHVLVLPSHNSKLTWLVEMLPILAPIGKMIIFVASRADCDAITKHISGTSVSIDSIHGDKHQSDRNAALSALRKGKIRALVATDVAARGLDVSDVMTVINFDPAKNLDSHVHRIGRAGRLNKDMSDPDKHVRGNAYTLLTSKNADFANVLLEAFVREGREVSDELSQLAMKSRHHGSGGRQKRNQSGLGYYGGSSDVGKRGRWG